MAGLCFTWLSAGISARELGFDPGPICKRFLVSGVAVGQSTSEYFSLRNAAFHLLRANIAIRVSGETLGTEKDTLLITGEHRNN